MGFLQVLGGFHFLISLHSAKHLTYNLINKIKNINLYMELYKSFHPFIL